MASVLIETARVRTRPGDLMPPRSVRIVLFQGVLERYIDDRWLIHDYQVMCEWWVGFDGHGAVTGPIAFK